MDETYIFACIIKNIEYVGIAIKYFFLNWNSMFLNFDTHCIILSKLAKLGKFVYSSMKFICGIFLCVYLTLDIIIMIILQLIVCHLFKPTLHSSYNLQWLTIDFLHRRYSKKIKFSRKMCWVSEMKYSSKLQCRIFAKLRKYHCLTNLHFPGTVMQHLWWFMYWSNACSPKMLPTCRH